jgi:hypothetical protein
MLGQFDDVSVEVSIAPAAAPGLVSRLVKDTSACIYRCSMGIFDAFDRQRDLSTGSRLLLGGIESEMKVGAVSPGDLRVAAAYPPVVNFIVPRMEVNAESVSVQSHRTIEIGDLQDDGDQPPLLSHPPSLVRLIVT